MMTSKKWICHLFLGGDSMETNTLEVKLKVCAGLDIHAKTVVACVLISSLDSLRAKKEIHTFGNTYFLVTFTWWVVNGKKSWKSSNGNLTNNSRSEKRTSEIILAKISPNLEQFASAKQLPHGQDFVQRVIKVAVFENLHIPRLEVSIWRPYFINAVEMRDAQVT